MGLAALLLLATAPASAAVPSVSHVVVTDVTDRSLAVVWLSSEQAAGTLVVFEGPDCSAPAAGVSLRPQPVLDPDPVRRDFLGSRAGLLGVLKVQALGLRPGNSYCVQTVTVSVSTQDTTISPPFPIRVTTVTGSRRSLLDPATGRPVPFGNDTLRDVVLAPDQVTALPGALLLADVPARSFSPLSRFAGDGITDPFVLLDLNNLFEASTSTSLDLQGGERLRLLQYRGLAGCILERFRKVPPDTGLGRLVEPAACFALEDVDCDDVVTVLDVARIVEALEEVAGSACFHPDLDLSGDGRVDLLDVEAAIARFGAAR